jgi:hypothetical protein
VSRKIALHWLVHPNRSDQIIVDFPKGLYLSILQGVLASAKRTDRKQSIAGIWKIIIAFDQRFVLLIECV